MENEIYIANGLADSYKKLPNDQQARVTDLIDSLNGEGWKNSQIVAPDNSQGGGLRARLSGNLRVLFRYDPEIKSIIVVDVSPAPAQKLATAS